jgi:dihydroorotase
MRYDLLLKGGHLIDPKNGIDQPSDLAITNGKVAAVDTDIPEGQASKVLDVSGLTIVPGLVDIHTHMYATPGNRHAWAGDNSILPDGFSFRAGVTTMADTGSAGWRNFEDFRYRVLDRFRTRTFAFLNIVGMGMISTEIEQNFDDMDIDSAAAVARENDDLIVGTKTAHYLGPEWTSVDRALALGKEIGKPTMIDFGLFPAERPYYELVTQRMRAGDISTHMYLGDVPWVDSEGRLLSYLHEARKRGVIFDVGHGGGSFCFRNAVPSIAQGFFPDSISTDLHTGCMNGPMMDMPNVMSKLFVIGMPLEDVIRASTWNPAVEIGHPELGHLSVGTAADVAALNIWKGDYTYLDVHRGTFKADKRLFCELTLFDGKVVWDWNGRTGIDYKDLPPDYGVRNKEDGLIMPPSA